MASVLLMEVLFEGTLPPSCKRQAAAVMGEQNTLRMPA